MQATSLPPLPLPAGITEDRIDCSASCGLNYHVLKAGQPGKPLILFCHGYPELSFSWRKVMPSIAAAGYYCVAMDQRGYGRTIGSDTRRPYDEVDLTQYTITNLVRDLVCLVYKLGYSEVKCIIGHDFGAVASAMAALTRPDMFQATVQMSHPYHPPPTPPFGDKQTEPKVDIQAELAKLNPPRKHYKWYNSTQTAAQDWDNPPQGLETFLRGYFHLKSSDWQPNQLAGPLTEWSAQALEQLPEYYIMRAQQTMPSSVAENMQNEADPTRTEAWLSPADLQVYCREWARTGFQGALNWYRAQTVSTPQSQKDMLLFAGMKIEVPCCFISGRQDWGNYQQPGALQSYEEPRAVRSGCFRGTRLIDGAGHWVQQEQPKAVVAEVLAFLQTL